MKYWIQILSIVVSLFAAAAFAIHGAGGLKERYLDYGLIISLFVASSSVLLLQFQHVVDKGFRELNKKVDELIERQKRETQNINNSLRRLIQDPVYHDHVASGGMVHVRKEDALEYDISELTNMMNDGVNYFYSTYIYAENKVKELEDIRYQDYISALVGVRSTGVEVKRLIVMLGDCDDFNSDFKKHLVYLADNKVEVRAVKSGKLDKDKADNFIVYYDQVGIGYDGGDGRFEYAVNYTIKTRRGAELHDIYYRYFSMLFNNSKSIDEHIEKWRKNV